MPNKGILNFRVLKAKSSTVRAADKLNESPMKSEFGRSIATVDTEMEGKSLDTITDPRVAVVWKGKQCISDVPDQEGEFEKVFDQEFDLKIDGDASLQERITVRVLDGESEMGSLKMKVKSMMEGGEQWYPLYKGNDCVGQLYIGSFFNEGAKYTSKIHKNWEAVDELDDEEEEEENYDSLQNMIIGNAAPVDPNGAKKLDMAINPEKRMAPKMEGPKLAKKVGCWQNCIASCACCGASKCCKPKLAAPKLKTPKMSAPKLSTPKVGCCSGMSCCKPKLKAPSISPPKLKAPKMSAPKLEGPKVGCCGAMSCMGCMGCSSCCKPKLKGPVIKPDLKMKAPKMSAPKFEGPKVGCCGKLSLGCAGCMGCSTCCKPKIKPPSISPPKLKAPKMSAPKIAGPKPPMCGSCCGPKVPKYQPQQNAFAVIPLDNTKLNNKWGQTDIAGMNKDSNTIRHQTAIPGYAIVPITQAQSYKLANSADPNKKIIPYDNEQLEQGITNLGVVPMSLPEEAKAVKASNELPAQKTKNEHQTSLKYVEQSVSKTPRQEIPQKQARQVHTQVKLIEAPKPQPVVKKHVPKMTTQTIKPQVRTISPAPKIKAPKMSAPKIEQPIVYEAPKVLRPAKKIPAYIPPQQAYVAPVFEPVVYQQPAPVYYAPPPVQRPAYVPAPNIIQRPTMPDIKMPSNYPPAPYYPQQDQYDQYNQAQDYQDQAEQYQQQAEAAHYAHQMQQQYQ